MSGGGIDVEWLGAMGAVGSVGAVRAVRVWAHIGSLQILLKDLKTRIRAARSTRTKGGQVGTMAEE